MTTEEVSKAKETIKKLEAILAPNSGSTENEKSTAKNKIAELKEKLKKAGIKDDVFTNSFLDAFKDALIKLNVERAQRLKEEFGNYKHLFSRAKRLDAQEFVEERKKSTSFLASIDLKDIKLYQKHYEVYLIAEMTTDFIRHELTNLQSRLQEISLQNDNLEVSEYMKRYRKASVEMMVKRLNMELDIRESIASAPKPNIRFKKS